MPQTDNRGCLRWLTDTLEVTAYIAGLAIMMITWSLIARAGLGNATAQSFDDNLINTTPGAQPGNALSAPTPIYPTPPHP